MMVLWMSGFCGCVRLWVLIWSRSSAVEAVGFDLEPIWCRGCGAVSRGAMGVGLSFGCRGLSFGCQRGCG
jgi:hypothetical protein